MATGETDDLAFVSVLIIQFIMALGACITILVLITNLGLSNRKSNFPFYLAIALLMAVKLVGNIYYGIRYISQLLARTDYIDSELVGEFQRLYQISLFLTDIVMIQLNLELIQKYYEFWSRAALSQVPTSFSQLLILLRILFFVVNAVFMTLFCTSTISDPVANLSFAVCNLATIAVSLTVVFALNYRFTGTMIKETESNYLGWHRWLLCSFFVSRSLEAVFGVLMTIQISNKEFINYIINHKDAPNVTWVILAAVCIQIFLWGLTEQLPFFLCVRKKTVKLLNEKWVENKPEDIDTATRFTTLLTEEASAVLHPEQDISGFQLTEVLPSHPHSMGILKKGIFKGKMVVLREIQCEMSKYLLQSLVQQIQQLKQLQIMPILSVRYFIPTIHRVYLISDYCEMSLAQYIGLRTQSLREKVALAAKISAAIQQLHRRDRAHGSLHVYNILLQKKDILLGDYGLMSLKKFLFLTQGYSNKSIYTAPEFLEERSLIISRASKKGDVYSFGMILYQLLTGITDYRDLSLQQVEDCLKQNLSRPKMPQQLPHNLRNLIKNCWQQEPDFRPDIEAVTVLLQQYSYYNYA